MPTYEYACTRCGAHVEVYQRFSDEPLRDCAVCGGPLRKVFHPAGIVFKGSGFYATDSRSAPKGKDEKPSEGSGEQQKKGDAQKKDGKTEGSSASKEKTA